MNGSTPSSSSSAPTRRLHALDNLRAAMMWLGIVLHVSVLYMSRPSPLPWHDDQSSPLADLLVAVIHAFRMPLFFILAGFFVAALVQRPCMAEPASGMGARFIRPTSSKPWHRCRGRACWSARRFICRPCSKLV